MDMTQAPTGLTVPSTRVVTRENLKLIADPAEYFGALYEQDYSKQYAPVSYYDLLNALENELKKVTGQDDVVQGETIYIKNKRKMPGAQMLAVFKLKGGGDGISPILACRSSHDKSNSVELAGGTNVSVCSNWELFRGDAMCRNPHKGDFWGRFGGMVSGVMGHIREIYRSAHAFRHHARHEDVSTDRGHEILGRMFAHNLLTPYGGSKSQIAIAHEQWDNPDHDEFLSRDAWSLFNACTEAKKRNSLNNVMRTGNDLRGFFVDEFGLPGSTRFEIIDEGDTEEEDDE